MHPELIEFGERVLFQPLDHKSLGSAQLQWQKGVFVGIRMPTGETIVATPEGICKTGSMRRRIESERWDPDEIMKVTGTPWKPYLFPDKDDLLTRPPPPAIDKLEDDHQGPKKQMQRKFIEALL